LVDTVCNSTRSNHFNIGLTTVNITCNERNLRRTTYRDGCTISQSSNARCTNLLTGQCQDKLSCSIRSTGQRRRHNIRKTCNRIVNSSASNRVIKRINQVDTDTVLRSEERRVGKEDRSNMGLTKDNITCNERNLRRTTYRDGCTISQSSTARCIYPLPEQRHVHLSCSIRSTGQRRRHNIRKTCNRIVNSSASNRVIKRINQVDTDTVLVDTVCNSTRSDHFNIGLTKVNITCNERNLRRTTYRDGCTISQSSNARCTNLLTGQCQDKLSCSIRSTGQRRRHNIRKTCNRIVNSSASNRVIKRINQVDTDTVLVDTVCNSTR